MRWSYLIKDIRVITTDKPKMFLLFHTVYISYGYFTIASNECLESALSHEEGHLEIFKDIFSVVLVIFVMSSILFFMLPLFVRSVFIGLLYLWFCHLCRVGELNADRYALRNTNLAGVQQYLYIEHKNLDTKLSMVLYPLRFHPTYFTRLRALHNGGV